MTALLLGVSAVLLILNGIFVGAEFALTGARRPQIEQLAQGGNRRARIALAGMRELPLMLAGAQLGVTMASLGLGYVAEPAVAHLLEGAFSGLAIPDGVLHSAAFVIGLVIVVFGHLVVGEMGPKNLTLAGPERSALILAPPTRIFVNVFRPFVHLLNALARLCLRALGVAMSQELEHSPDTSEIAMVIEESAREGVFDEGKRRLLSGAITFGDRDAASVMVPRTEVAAVPLSATPAAIEALVVDTGHSRLPVYGADLDHILGFFHSKDLLRVSEDDREQPLKSSLIRQMLVVPESRKLRPLLLDMKHRRDHIALVIDEHGGTGGIVTLEDVLEELVGEIRDEYDAGELGVEELGHDRYLVPGSLRIDEANGFIGMTLPEGDYDTVGGWLMDSLGRIPKRRDVLEHEGWRLRVRTMHRRRVVTVLVEAAGAPGEPETLASGRDHG